MPIPTPPTDSLYKFKAIAGILLVVASVYIFVMLQTNWREKDEQIRIDLATNEAKIQSLREQQSILEHWKAQYIEQMRPGYQPVDTVLYVLTSEDYKTLLFKTWDASQEIRILLAVSKERLITKSDLTDAMREASVGLLFLFFVGLFAALWGFWQWHSKVQRLLDRILEQQADNVMDRE